MSPDSDSRRDRSSSRPDTVSQSGSDSDSSDSDREIYMGESPPPTSNRPSPSRYTGPDPGVAACYAQIRPEQLEADLAEIRPLYGADAEREAAAYYAANPPQPRPELPTYYAADDPRIQPDGVRILPSGYRNPDGSFTGYTWEQNKQHAEMRFRAAQAGEVPLSASEEDIAAWNRLQNRRRDAAAARQQEDRRYLAPALEEQADATRSPYVGPPSEEEAEDMRRRQHLGPPSKREAEAMRIRRDLEPGSNQRDMGRRRR